MKSRIAPTPSGCLHRGNVFNALLTWVMAASAGGTVRLRIDDLDAPRARPEYLAGIFSKLRGLGLTWGEGPQTVEEHEALYSQRLRIPRYNGLIAALADAGHLFACRCSRTEIAASGQPCPRGCVTQAIALRAPDTSLRLRAAGDTLITLHDGVAGPVSMPLASFGIYPVIRRRDGLPAYHIASVVDDVDFEITHVVRGADLLSSTAVQIQIARLLGLEIFEAVQFFHHPLLRGADGTKLSKSAGVGSSGALGSGEHSNTALLQEFCSWMAWPEAQVSSVEDLVPVYEQFGLEGLRRAAR